MSHTKYNQFNDTTWLATADGTIADELSHAILETELARDVLGAIVGGQVTEDSSLTDAQYLQNIRDDSGAYAWDKDTVL